MSDFQRRNAEFIGTLFVNTSKAGKKYLKGTINGLEVFGHLKQKPRQDNPEEMTTYFSIELVKDENGQVIKREQSAVKSEVKAEKKVQQKRKAVVQDEEDNAELPF